MRASYPPILLPLQEGKIGHLLYPPQAFLFPKTLCAAIFHTKPLEERLPKRPPLEILRSRVLARYLLLATTTRVPIIYCCC